MKQLLLLGTLLMCFHSLGAVNYTITSQSEWDLVPSPLASGDTAFIAEGAVIVNMMPREIIGTLVNDGDFTHNNPGVQLSMMGTIINNGTFSVGNSGPSIFGLLVNTGTFKTIGAGMVIQPGGTMLNTGTVDNMIDIQNNGTFATCSTVIGNQPSNMGINGTVPMGTACNDGDDATSNDMIIDDMCTCQGAAPIPTMPQWFLFISGLLLLSVAVVTIKKAKLA